MMAEQQGDESMKQYEAVILALERLGGQATLEQLYREVMKVEGCVWGTKTPFASIRRIVQTRPEIFKVRPGLWALRAYQQRLGLTEYGKTRETAPDEQGHAYYQGILATIGNLRNLGTYIPQQDRNKPFLNKRLGEVPTLQTLPRFTYDHLMRYCETIDVVWLNSRQMPHSLFEVEHSTDMQNAMLKFYELQDFHMRMVIVADARRRREFEDKKRRSAFEPIRDRMQFLDYEALIRLYEREVERAECVI